MEYKATRRFSAETAERAGAGGSVARELETAEVIRFLEYRGPRGSVQPGNPEGVRLP
jgi:hypothetical protein